MLRAYRKTCTWIYRIMIAVCIVLVILMIVASGLQVFSRYVLNSRFSWTDECARYCLLWFNLIGSGCLVKSKGHAIVDLFSGKLKGNTKRIYNLAIHLLIFYMGIILAKYGLALCKVTMRQTSTALKLPIGLVYGALPVLGMLILIYEVEAIWCILAGYSDGKEEI